MREYYRIHPSRILFGLSLGAQVLIALAIVFYVDPGPLMYGGTVLPILLAIREYAHWRQLRTQVLEFDPRGPSITLQNDGQPYFQGKYKVYANRWFAILKLNDQRKSRTLILHPERFDSVRSYRHLRFVLAGEERSLAT